MTDQTPSPQSVVDWSEYQDDISDAISDSIDMDWNANDGARAVVRWLNENAPYQAPAPSSLAGGEVRDAVARTEDRIGSRLMKAKDEAWNLVPQGQRAKWIEDNLASATVEVSYSDLRTILAALSPEAPARDGADERAAYLRDNLDVILRAVVDMAKVGIEVAKQGSNYHTESRDRARIEFVEEVCRRWAALTPRHEAEPIHTGETPSGEAALYRDLENGVRPLTAPRHEAPAEGAGEPVAWRTIGPYGEYEALTSKAAAEHRTREAWGKPVEPLYPASALRTRSSAPEAREGEAVGYANAEFMRRLKNWRDVIPNSIRSDETFLKAVASESYPVPLYTHPAAPSADKLRIAVEELEKARDRLDRIRWVREFYTDGKHIATVTKDDIRPTVEEIDRAISVLAEDDA